MRPAFIEIDVAAFSHNLAEIRRIAPHSNILAIVKANAYGHKITHFIDALKQADGAGVACLEEALALRHAQLNIPILLLEGFFTENELPIIAQNNFMCVIHHQAQLDILEKIKLSLPIKVWLKLDSGMHRLGFSVTEFKSAYERLARNKNVLWPPLLMSHFACADEIQNPSVQNQLAVFEQTIQGMKGEISLANSAALLALPNTHRDWVRPGLALYGISPFANQTGQTHHFKPVMTFRSNIIAIRHIKQGDSVGYGATWTATKDSVIGVVAVGYADGYPRHAKNFTPVLVNDKEVPLIGRVSMDMLTVDLSQYPDTAIGSPVVLWGKGLPIETIAQCADTIPYELICAIYRSPRLYQSK